MVTRTPRWLSRPCTSAFTLRARSTSAKRTCPCSSRSTSSSPASSAGSSLSIRPSASTATPKCRPMACRLMIAPSTMSQIAAKGTYAEANSSAITVSVAPAALPIPSARCPALRPMATTTYQRRVDRASSMRLRTSSTPAWRAVWKPNVGTCGGRGRSLSIVFGTCTTRMAPCECSPMVRDESAVSSPPIVIRCVMPACRSVSTDRGGRLRRPGRVLARGAEHGAAEEVHPRDVGDGERPELREVAAHEVLEAVPDAHDLEALVDGFDRGRGDDGVDPRSRAAADQDAEASGGRHALMLRAPGPLASRPGWPRRDGSPRPDPTAHGWRCARDRARFSPARAPAAGVPTPA